MNSEIKDRAAKARRELGISQAELSRRIGVKQQSIQQLEDGIVKKPRYLVELAEALNVSPKWLASGEGEMRPSSLTSIQQIEAWDSKSPEDPDEVEVPLFREVELAAGNGHTHQIEYNGAKLKFARSSLQRQGVPDDAAACCYVSGNSMEPILPDGATVGVDTSNTAVVDGKLYALDQDGHLRIKQLYRVPATNGLRLRSFNREEHPDEDYPAEYVQEHIRIIGKVFWSAAFWS